MSGPVQDYDTQIDTEKIDVYRDYREHFYGCFIDDATGLGMLDVVGEDNVMIETDYPHSDTTWPYSLKLAHERLDAAGLSPERPVQDPARQRREAVPVRGVGAPQGDPALALTPAGRRDRRSRFSFLGGICFAFLFFFLRSQPEACRFAHPPCDPALEHRSKRFAVGQGKGDVAENHEEHAQGQHVMDEGGAGPPAQREESGTISTRNRLRA